MMIPGTEDPRYLQIQVGDLVSARFNDSDDPGYLHICGLNESLRQALG